MNYRHAGWVKLILHSTGEQRDVNAMPEEQQVPESKKEIKVAVDGQFSLELQEVPRAGYEWAFEFATDKLKIVDNTFERADDAIGSGGIRR